MLSNPAVKVAATAMPISFPRRAEISTASSLPCRIRPTLLLRKSRMMELLKP